MHKTVIALGILFCAHASSIGAERLPFQLSGSVAVDAGPRPSVDSSRCKALPISKGAEGSIAGMTRRGYPRAAELGSIRIANELFRVFPEEYRWWIRRVGGPSYIGVGVAIHETAHTVNRVYKLCHRVPSAFWVVDKVYVIDPFPEQTKAVADLDEALLDSLKSSIDGNRFRQYIILSRAFGRTDLYLVLEELAAYVTGAAVEMMLLTNGNVKVEVGSGQSANTNIGGMYDFLLILDVYLMSLKQASPATFAMLVGSAEFRCLVTRSKAVALEVAGWIERDTGKLQLSHVLVGASFSRFRSGRLGVIQEVSESQCK